MNNSERRSKLADARDKAVYYAELAENKWVENSKDFSQVVMLADTFANVAKALKSGDAVSDLPEH